MYNEFYGFSEKPFEVNPNPKFLYFTSSHREALDAMIKGIKSRQDFICITGEVGTGKTTLIHSLLTSLDRKVKTAFIFDTLMNFEELLASILRELNVEVTGKDKRALLYQLFEYQAHIDSDESIAVIIDEAQLLPKETLQEWGKLSDLGFLASGRLQIIFVGQPEFEDILNLPILKMLNQKIVIRHRIETLTNEESRHYIEHRLKLVGSRSSRIFTPKAISMITEYAKGIPRVINILSDNSLLYGFSKSKKTIDPKIIREVIKDLEGPIHRKSALMRIFSFVKIPQTILWKRNISLKKISYIIMFLLSMAGIVFLVHGLFLLDPASKRNIKSLRIYLSQTKPSLIKPYQTTAAVTSKGDDIYLPVETHALTIKNNESIAPPSASSLPLITKTTSSETIIVKKGQNISLLGEQYYGMSNVTVSDFILAANPEITNANVISVDQKIRMPKITEDSLIFQIPEQTYKINVGTYWSPEFAKLYKSEPSLQGYNIEIIARKVTPTETWYRIVAGTFNSKADALKAISILKNRNMLPLFGADPQIK